MMNLNASLKILLTILNLLFSLSYYFGQGTKTEIILSVNFGDSALKLQKYYRLNDVDSIQLTIVKFYLSSFELYQDEKLVWKEDGKFRLIDMEDRNSMHFNLSFSKPISFNTISFNLGIDSVTNVSGAMGGDLDPTKRMYWTWQSGYINFKLEGNSNLCSSRHNEFVFHLGGYQSPFLGLQHVKRKVQNENRISLVLDTKTILKTIDLKKQNHIMSPSKDAVELAERVSQAIKIN